MDEVKAHWIFSGDNDDYDGYYINCSSCEIQRKAYDRNCDLDIPVACPHCGIAIDVEHWEYRDSIKNSTNNDENKKWIVSISYAKDNGIVHPYIFNVVAPDKTQAVDMAILAVAKMYPCDWKAHEKMKVDSVEEYGLPLESEFEL